MQDSLLDRLHLPAGARLFAAGESGAAAYLVESGCLEIYLERPEGDMVLARRGPGEIIGEMSILDRRPRSASVRAVADSALIVVTEEQIAHRISETDPILRMCLGVVIERYRETVAMLEQMKGTAPSPQPMGRSMPEDFAPALETLVLERELRRALQQNELELFFQPIVRLKTRQLAGFEALMRWRHPLRGLVQPGDFIPVAEASGLISDLTFWAVGEVGRVFPEITLASLDNVGNVEGPLFLSVNVSGQDLARPSFPQTIIDLLDRTGIHPGSIKLEVTESTLMKNPEQAAAALTLCRQGGMGIAIDDFGTGYSSLSYLSTLPITTLKVDRAFVRAMLADPISSRIVGTILRLADELGIPVVAEGIEQQAEAQKLTGMGCDFGQGYLFGRPAPLAEAVAMARHWAVQSTRTRRAVR